MNHISPVIWQFLVKWLTNSGLLPPEASKIAPQMDALLFFMVLVSLIGLTIVALLVTSFSILYNKKRHPVAVQVEGSTLLEATWTIIPLGLFLVMFVWGALIYFRVFTPPANATIAPQGGCRPSLGETTSALARVACAPPSRESQCV